MTDNLDMESDTLSVITDVSSVITDVSSVITDVSSVITDVSSDSLDKMIIKNKYFFTISIERDGNNEKLHHRTKEGLLQLYKERMELK